MLFSGIAFGFGLLTLPPPGITGRIVDAQGCPLIVDLKLRPATAPFVDGALQETRSDMEGHFAFTDVAPGRYWIHYDLVPDGGWGGDGVVVTDEGAYKEFHWPVPKFNPLDFKDRRFIVTDADGSPLAGAKVSWRRFSGAVGGPACGEDTTTNRDGRAMALQSPPGTYRVIVEADGYAPQTRDVKFGWGNSDTMTIRLLTPIESERASRTYFRGCRTHDSPPVDTLPHAAAAADAIVVGRIVTAVPDPDFSAGDADPEVRTRYDLQLLDVVKPHVNLTSTARSVGIVHEAGELDWGSRVLVGCQGVTMRAGEVFVLFLAWNERLHTFTPMGGSGLIANITSGSVAPIRASVTPGAVVNAALGQAAPEYVRTVKAAVR